MSRVAENAVKVTVTGDGLSSDAKYELRIQGYDQAVDEPSQLTHLVSARFSPTQDGRLAWSHVVDISAPTASQPINYVQVVVAKEDAEDLSCPKASADKVEEVKPAPTCLYTKLPPYNDAGATDTTGTTDSPPD